MHIGLFCFLFQAQLYKPKYVNGNVYKFVLFLIVVPRKLRLKSVRKNLEKKRQAKSRKVRRISILVIISMLLCLRV